MDTQTNNTFDISIVIPTYNRADTLATTLDRIANQTVPAARIQVVISDDGSPDQTAQMAEEAKQKYEMEIVYEKHENRGVGYTQNRAIELASASLLLLIADDIWLEPGAVQAHIDMHRKKPADHVAVLGTVYQSEQLNQSAFLRTWDPFQFKSLKDRELPYYMFWACHISFKKAFMIEHGMFREDLAKASYAAHEDTELGYRLHINGGLELFHCPEAVGKHYHVTTLDTELKRSFGRGINWQGLREHVSEPEISVRFHVLMWSTIREHIDALRRRRGYLMGGDRSALRLAANHLLRIFAFNKLTVKGFWLPVFHLAEKNSVIERLMHYQFYRGVIYYHFLMGCRKKPA